MNNDPKNKKPQDNKPQNGDDGRQGRRIIFLMVAALIATLLINSLYTTIANAYLSEITYNEFQTYLDKDEIAELEFQSDRMVILTRDEAKKPSAQQRLYYTGYIPNVSNDELKARLDAQAVTLTIEAYLRTQTRENRQLFLRRYYYGDSVRRLSGLFGLTENTVKSRLFRLRAGLRDALLKEGIAV